MPRSTFVLPLFVSAVRRSAYGERAKRGPGWCQKLLFHARTAWSGVLGGYGALKSTAAAIACRFSFLQPITSPFSGAFRPLLRLLSALRVLPVRALRALNSVVRAVRRVAALISDLWSRTVLKISRSVVVKLFENKRLVRTIVQAIIPANTNLADSRAATRAMRISRRLIAIRIPILSRAVLRLVELVMMAMLTSQMTVGNQENTVLLARIINLSLRPLVRQRKMPLSFLYFQALFHTRRYHRVVKEIGVDEQVDSHYLNHMFGISYLFSGNPAKARSYLERGILFHDQYFLDYRMLGRACLLLGDEKAAEAYFARSVELAPYSVMAHQNYAGRYDIPNYKPNAWELKKASRLLFYDNLGQLGEEFFLLGDFDTSFRCYQKMLDFQKRARTKYPLTKKLLDRLQADFPRFDRSKPVRLLPYEWVTQFGHIGLLDSYIKMARLGMYPDANYVLLAPKDKVVNAEYLAFWDEFFLIVRDEDLVDDLFPYQRSLGDNFMAYPGQGGKAEPWTKIAAEAHAQWARRKLKPVLSLSPEDRLAGEESLRKLGVPEGGWYVGLHVREGGYYGESAGGISTHRNSQISDYLSAVKAITDAGGTVIRLGDKSMRPLEPVPGLVDYALSDEKSPSMDIFLCATSRFVIGTTSGLTTACISFGTPMLLVNCISNDWQLWSGNTDFILKRVHDIRNKRFLTFAEMFSQPVQGYLINSVVMRRNGLEAVSNTSDEIREAILYKLRVMDGKAAPEDRTWLSTYAKAMAGNPMMFGAARPVVPFLQRHPALLDRAVQQGTTGPAIDVKRSRSRNKEVV